MKHRKKHRILGRTSTQRSALLQSMSKSLLAVGSLTTTRARGQELRRFVEPLITQARRELTLHRRRQLIRHLGRSVDVDRLVAVAVVQQRTSGYLRLTRLPQLRQDAAAMVRVDLIDFTPKAT